MASTKNSLFFETSLVFDRLKFLSDSRPPSSVCLSEPPGLSVASSRSWVSWKLCKLFSPPTVKTVINVKSVETVKAVKAVETVKKKCKHCHNHQKSWKLCKLFLSSTIKTVKNVATVKTVKAVKKEREKLSQPQKELKIVKSFLSPYC